MGGHSCGDNNESTTKNFVQQAIQEEEEENNRATKKKSKHRSRSIITTVNNNLGELVEWSSLPAELWSCIFACARFPISNEFTKLSSFDCSLPTITMNSTPGCSLVNSTWNELYRRSFCYLEHDLSWTNFYQPVLAVIHLQCIENKSSPEQLEHIKTGLELLMVSLY